MLMQHIVSPILASSSSPFSPSKLGSPLKITYFKGFTRFIFKPAALPDVTKPWAGKRWEGRHMQKKERSGGNEFCLASRISIYRFHDSQVPRVLVHAQFAHETYVFIVFLQSDLTLISLRQQD